MPKTENSLTWRATTPEKVARDKHDQLAIKYLKFENSRRKSTVTNKTSNTKRYKNILSRSITSKQNIWHRKVIKNLSQKYKLETYKDKMTKKQKKRKKPLLLKARKTRTDLTDEWIPSATETCEVDVNVLAARMTRQSIKYINDVPYYPLGVSIRHDLYMIWLMFPKIPKNKLVNLWFNPNEVLLPLRELLHNYALPSLIGQTSYSRFAGQIQARILKTSAAELIEQFWSKVVKDKNVQNK